MVDIFLYIKNGFSETIYALVGLQTSIQKY